ncbi:MAG: ferrous iron transporter B [Lachnospiraceae bacterium]|nr:ferrous iron transporter B [Lachnospiraceae bacterium]
MSIKIALAGNPNCGKTTLFNALTGANQFVGNWPGVTVEKKEGKLKKTYGVKEQDDVVITDLPGIYSLSPYTLEEVVARNYLINEKPDVILNIVDGTNIERNLYLSTQLMELGIPVVMAVNMMDVVEKNGDKIHIDKLSKELGCEAVEISALKGTGIQKAAMKAIAAASREKEAPVHEFTGEVELAIHAVEERLGEDVKEEQKRFFAIKLLERDDKIVEQMQTVPDITEEIENLEKTFDDDTESIITNERYVYISSIIDECCTKNKKNKMTRSDKIDRIVTNRFLALPIFAVIMFIVYYVSVTTIGTYATDWTNDGLFGDGWYLVGIGRDDYEEATDDWADNTIFSDGNIKAVVDAAAKDGNVIGADEVREAYNDKDFGAFEEAYGSYGEDFAERGYDLDALLPLDEEGEWDGQPDPSDYGIWVPSIPDLVSSGLEAIGCAEWLNGLIIDGIIGGVGAVLGFVPQMLVLFIFLAFLEGCGYMARVAFIMDRIFRRFGLSGKSFIPMLIGTGCGVPGVMASRTIENDRDRKMTIMTTTFIPCGAKLPIIALLTSALFGGAGWVAPSTYFLGIAAIVISGVILKKTKMFSGEPAPFVMELPAYHLPTVGAVLRSMWERGWSFIKKAGTIILLSSIVIWAGSVFGVENGSFGFNPDMELENSILGYIGSAIQWIFTPLGFGNIKATIATVMGLVAKEEVVGVFGVLDFEGMIPIAGYAFLTFNLLCAPCFAAIGAIRREMNNGKWTAFAIAYQCIFAYVIALIIYRIGLLVTGVFSVWTVIALLLIVGLIYLMVRPYKESNTLKLSGKSSLAGVK